MDQAEPLRQLAQRLSPLSEGVGFSMFSNTPRTLAITSGKGGVGKSNIAINLAIALGRMKKRVLIFDADMGMANVDVLLGITPRYNLQHVISGEKSLNEILFVGPEGILILPGSSGIKEIANLEETKRNALLVELEQFENRVDMIILDTGPGLSGNVLNFVLAAHEVLVVTTPEPTAIVDAYAMIKIIAQENPNGKIGLLENMVASAAQAQHTHNTITIISKKFLNINLENMGYISYDLKIPKAVGQQVPFLLAYPACRASRDLNTLAAHLAVNAPSNARKVSFFEQLGKIFRAREEMALARKNMEK